MAYKIRDLAIGAMLEIRVARAGDTPPATALAFTIQILNELLDEWNIDARAVYSNVFTAFTLTPNHQPHTFGTPAADFAFTVRPVEVIKSRLILTNVTPNVYTPIEVRDEYWWNNVRVPGIATTIPTDLYYTPDFPLGHGYFWPVPTVAYGVEFLTRGLLAQVVENDDFSLPPGYKAALRLTLAERIASGFGKTVSRDTHVAAAMARGRIFGENEPDASISTQDSGLPSSQRVETFNYRSRSFGG